MGLSPESTCSKAQLCTSEQLKPTLDEVFPCIKLTQICRIRAYIRKLLQACLWEQNRTAAPNMCHYYYYWFNLSPVKIK